MTISEVDGESIENPNEMVGLGRLELPTSPLSGARSSHLSYRPTAGNSPALDLMILTWSSEEPYKRSARKSQLFVQYALGSRVPLKLVQTV